MKKLLVLLILFSTTCYSQITYVNNYNGVYPFPTNNQTYNLDLNNDGQNDVCLKYYKFIAGGSGGYTCGNIGDSYKYNAKFEGVINSYGQNKVNASANPYVLGIDCSNDTLNYLDQWNNQSMVWDGISFPTGLCLNFSFGAHKQGFRILMPNPQNGAMGYKYGYINYTLLSSGDIVIHNWYYENQFNNPIVANSQLTYPYNSNCIHIDTVKVYDTITTHINVYDTLYTTVTDTLLIKATLSVNPSVINSIQIFPNPAKDHIIINNGNYTGMAGYTIEIKNSTGQQVFFSQINQQQFNIDLNSWTGTGIYYVTLKNSLGNIITIRKILIQ
jgi:hypothetical protein